jgi:hypothetical protein
MAVTPNQATEGTMLPTEVLLQVGLDVETIGDKPLSAIVLGSTLLI